MKILVAGGAGYIGSVLAPMLQEHGYETEVCDLLWFGNYLPPEIRVYERNLFELTDKELQDYEQVIFLAGLSNDPMAEFNPARNFVENGALPSYLAFRAKQAGVRRFIYASSCSVYGYTMHELYDEDSPVTCGYPYGISKLGGERGVLQLAGSDFSAIALRQGTVNGHSPRMRFDLIVNTMFKTALREGTITVNNPSIWRPLIDVRDTAAAFLRAVQADYGISGVFNVAVDNFTVGQVADLVKDTIEESLGKKVRITMKNIQDYRNYKVSCERARTCLGFAPKYGVPQMVDSLIRNSPAYGDFEDENYYNIRIFEQIERQGR